MKTDPLLLLHNGFMSLNLLVTGGSGFLGTRLLERLLDEPKVRRIWVLDIAEPALHHPKLAFTHHDISQPYPAPPFAIERMAHLAFLLNPIRDLTRQTQVNLTGTQHCLDFCETHGVTHLTAVSSGTAYGAHEDNPPLLKEDHPLRAEPDFPYAYEKRRMEDMLWDWRKGQKQTTLAVLRPCIVLGPEVNNYISRTMAQKLSPCVAGHNPLFQFVHVADVAKALAVVILKQGAGAYNVAGDNPLPYYDALKKIGSTPLPLPGFLKDNLGELLWQTGVLEGPPGMMPFLTYPWLMDSTRLETELGFSFSYDSRDALASWAKTMK